MNPVTKRRWFQWSLRTLFLVVTACAVATPRVPPIWSRIDDWWNPPKQSGVWMILPRGVIILEEEQLLTEPADSLTAQENRGP
jgi:hypothetical protein